MPGPLVLEGRGACFREARSAHGPEDADIFLRVLRHELRDMRRSVVSQWCRPRFLGYLASQRRKLIEKGDTGHGADSDRGEKWASHMVRLGFEGRELLATGELTLPMNPDEAEYCKAIKRGEVSAAEAFARAEQLEADIAGITRSPLPEAPDIEAIGSWMHSVYRRAWAMALPSRSRR